MGIKFIEMTYKEWVEKYIPVLDEYGEVRMFENYAEDLEFLKSQNVFCIWTEKDVEGYCTINSGVWIIDRIGLYVTKNPFEPDERIQIFLYNSNDEEDG